MKKTHLLTTVMSNAAAAPVNMVTNGDFAADASWTKDAGWTIAAGVATCAISDNQIFQGNLVLKTPMINGQSYSLTYTIVTRAAGVLIARIGNTFLTGRSAPGTYTESGVYDPATPSLGFYSSGFLGSIDNVQLFSNP
jgi:hypothetical protein